MSKHIERVYTVCLLSVVSLFGSSLALSGRLVAQTTCDPLMDTCTSDVTPPDIHIAPVPAMVHSAAVGPVRIVFCDQQGLDYSTMYVSLNGVDVTSSLYVEYPPSDSACGYSTNLVVGTLTVSAKPGRNDLYASISDLAYNFNSSQTSFAYPIGEVSVKGRPTTRRGAGGVFSQAFVVKNVGTEAYGFALRPKCTSMAACTLSKTSISLASQASDSVQVTYTVPPNVGSQGTVGVSALYTADSAAAYAMDFAVRAITPTVTPHVTPRVLAVPAVAANASNSQIFYIKNVGNISTSYTLRRDCSGGVTGCGTGGSISMASTSNLMPGDSVAISVPYGIGVAGTVGSLTLNATSGTETAAGVINATSAFASTPFVTLDSMESGFDRPRSECVNAAIGSGAAYECGDLRLAHSLPTIKTFNQTRGLTLLYNSAAADPSRLVAAYVTLPRIGTRPSKIVAILKVNGVARDSAEWDGLAWGVLGKPYRIALRLRGTAQDPLRVRYSLDVARYDGTTRSVTTVSGTVIMPNGAASPIGAGWRVGGVESLVWLSGDSAIWVGGDGSTRLYWRAAGQTNFAARAIYYPDSLKPTGNTFTRYARNGLRVQFDSAGRHVATINRFGRRTNFLYDASSRLSAIQMPTASGTTTDSLIYVNGFLQRYVSAAGNPLRRETTLTTNTYGQVTTIKDPDSTQVSFQ